MKKTKDFAYYLAGSVSLMTFVVYVSSLKNDFVLWDDDVYVLDNPFIRSFDVNFFKRAFLGSYDSNWFPLTWISHALDYAVWGLDPMGHHLTNNILHVMNTFLVVLLVVRLLESWQAYKPTSQQANKPAGLQAGKLASFSNSSAERGPACGGRFTLIAAGVTGLFFGLHPLHVESAVWVSERKDLLCAMFYLLSIMAYLKYAATAVFNQKADLHHRGTETQRDSLTQNPFSVPQCLRGLFSPNKYYLLALCFFIFALLSKPMAISLPIVLLILDWHPFRRITSPGSFGTALTEKLPFIALSLVSSILTILAQKAGGAIGSLENASLSVRVLIAIKSLAAYLLKMALPLNLVPFYPYPRTVIIFSLEYLLPIAVVIGITITSVVIAKKRKLWTLVWGYYVITLLPVLGIIRIGGQEMADRYTYLPSLGPFLIMGLGAAWLWEKTCRSARWRSSIKTLNAAIAILIFMCMSYLTVKQIGIWKNSDTLWAYVIEKEPGRVPRAYKNRANYFLRLGHYDKAVADYDMLLFLDPSNYDAYVWRMIAVSALLDRGKAYHMQGNEKLAIPDFRKACEFGNDDACNFLKALGVTADRRK